MHVLGALLALLASHLVAASPGLVKLDFTKQGRQNDVSAKSLTSRADQGTVNAPLMEARGGLLYFINITVGTPGQTLAVQLDTGSSDLWIPSAEAPICRNNSCPAGAFDSSNSSTYNLISNDFSLHYLDPKDIDAGDYITDVLSISGATINDMQMGLASDAVDGTGVMGISFTRNEAICSESGECDRLVPTVVDQLKAQGYIQRNAYSLYLNDLQADTGSILFGGVDTARYHGDLISLPLQNDGRTNLTDLVVTLSSVSIRLDTGTTVLSSSNLSVPAVLDSGTQDTQLPAEIAFAIVSGMGAIEINGAQFVPCRYTNGDASLIFGFGGPGGPNVSVPISEMLVDAGFQFEDGSDACYLGIEPVQVDFTGPILLGDSFLRSAYVVFDLDNQEIALAQTNFNATDSNIVVIPFGSGLPGVSSTATQAVVLPTTTTLVSVVASATNAAPSGKGYVEGTPTFDLGAGVSMTRSATASASATQKATNGAGAGPMTSFRAGGQALALCAALLWAIKLF